MKKYSLSQIEEILLSMTILVDSREQNTSALKMRLDGLQCPSRRVKLDYGDYSCEYIETDGKPFSASTVACVERKMSLDELAMCFTSGRERFKREFERAKSDGCHVHLIVENDNYEKLFSHKYRSQLLPQSFIASLLSWQCKYGFQIHFCNSDKTPRLIHDILYYELRNYLLNQ